MITVENNKSDLFMIRLNAFNQLSQSTEQPISYFEVGNFYFSSSLSSFSTSILASSFTSTYATYKHNIFVEFSSLPNSTFSSTLLLKPAGQAFPHAAPANKRIRPGPIRGAPFPPVDTNGSTLFITTPKRSSTNNKIENDEK
jgi:hypothetical protein